MSKITKPAVEAMVVLGTDTSILAFMLDSGEIRYSKTGAALLLRDTSSWINELESKTPKLFKALLDKGYTDSSQRVSVKRSGKRGATFAETISLDDLNILIDVEATRGNPRAMALVVAGFRQYLIDQSRTSFGIEARTQQEKLEDFETWQNAYLANKEDWEYIEEQESMLSMEPQSMWSGYEFYVPTDDGGYDINEVYIPTADGYDDDRDCYQL